MFTLLAAVVRGILAWQQRQRIENELYAMDDRSLADIGLNRADIPFAVTGRASVKAEPRQAVAPQQPVPANQMGGRQAA